MKIKANTERTFDRVDIERAIDVTEIVRTNALSVRAKKQLCRDAPNENDNQIRKAALAPNC